MRDRITVGGLAQDGGARHRVDRGDQVIVALDQVGQPADRGVVVVVLEQVSVAVEQVGLPNIRVHELAIQADHTVLVALGHVLPVLGQLAGEGDADDLAVVVALDAPLAILVLLHAVAIRQRPALLLRRGLVEQAGGERRPHDLCQLGRVRRLGLRRVVELGVLAGVAGQDGADVVAPRLRVVVGGLGQVAGGGEALQDRHVRPLQLCRRRAWTVAPSRCRSPRTGAGSR